MQNAHLKVQTKSLVQSPINFLTVLSTIKRRRHRIIAADTVAPLETTSVEQAHNFPSSAVLALFTSVTFCRGTRFVSVDNLRNFPARSRLGRSLESLDVLTGTIRSVVVSKLKWCFSHPFLKRRLQISPEKSDSYCRHLHGHSAVRTHRGLALDKENPGAQRLVCYQTARFHRPEIALVLFAREEVLKDLIIKIFCELHWRKATRKPGFFEDIWI